MNLFINLILNGRKVILARHSKTNKPIPQEGWTARQTDEARALTEEGCKIAHTAGERIETTTVSAVFYSSARRCGQTAERLLGGDFKLVPHLPIEAAYPYSRECRGADKINEVFHQIGNGTLAAYDNAGCADALNEYADGVFKRIELEVNGIDLHLHGDVLIVTHGVCVAALARRLADRVGHDANEINEFLVDECGMMIVDMNGIVCIKPPVIATASAS